MKSQTFIKRKRLIHRGIKCMRIPFTWLTVSGKRPSDYRSDYQATANPLGYSVASTHWIRQRLSSTLCTRHGFSSAWIRMSFVSFLRSAKVCNTRYTRMDFRRRKPMRTLSGHRTRLSSRWNALRSYGFPRCEVASDLLVYNADQMSYHVLIVRKRSTANVEIVYVALAYWDK